MSKESKGLSTDEQLRIEAELVALIGRADQARHAGSPFSEIDVALALWAVDPARGRVEAAIAYEVGADGGVVHPNCERIVCHHGSTLRGVTKRYSGPRGEFDNALYGGFRPEAKVGETGAVGTYIDVTNVPAFLRVMGLPPANLENIRKLLEDSSADPYAVQKIEEALLRAGPPQWDLGAAPITGACYVKVLVSGHCNPDLKGKLLAMSDGHRAIQLEQAVLTGQTAWISDLLDAGMSIQLRVGGLMEWTALHIAADNVTVTKFLISRGADVSARTAAGGTPLHAAVANVEVCRALIGAGADVLAADRSHETALHASLKRPAWGFPVERKIECANLLIENGADPLLVPDVEKDYVRSPFQSAVESGLPEQVGLVLDRFQIDFGQRTRDGKTLEQLCKKNDPDSIRTMLRAAKTARAILDATGSQGGVAKRRSAVRLSSGGPI